MCHLRPQVIPWLLLLVVLLLLLHSITPTIVFVIYIALPARHAGADASNPPNESPATVELQRRLTDIGFKTATYTSTKPERCCPSGTLVKAIAAS